jgi:hypothetical protein
MRKMYRTQQIHDMEEAPTAGKKRGVESNAIEGVSSTKYNAHTYNRGR